MSKESFAEELFDEEVVKLWARMTGFRVSNNHRRKCCVVACEVAIEALREVEGSELEVQWWMEVKDRVEGYKR